MKQELNQNNYVDNLPRKNNDSDSISGKYTTHINI